MKLNRRSFFAAIAAAVGARKLPAADEPKRYVHRQYALGFEYKGSRQELEQLFPPPYYPGKVFPVLVWYEFKPYTDKQLFPPPYYPGKVFPVDESELDV